MNREERVNFLLQDAEIEEDIITNSLYPAKGREVTPIFKILLTNLCKEVCLYCKNNLHSNCPRYKLEPLKLSKLFLNLYNRKVVKGLFLSSSIYKNPDFSQEKILETLIILRKKFGYQGYIHAKVLPGVDFSLIEKLFNYADRVSINLEAPAQKYLSKICEKNLYDDLIKRLRYLSKINKIKRVKAGITTQLVVGINEEKDKEILGLAFYLYKELNLSRVYYKGFEPIKGTPLYEKELCNPWRIKRLYEADFLIRDYNFDYKDFLYDERGNLILNRDVKESYAVKKREIYPINVNKAGIEELIKIPGIGKKRGYQILSLRKNGCITSFSQLEKIGIPKKAQKWLCY